MGRPRKEASEPSADMRLRAAFWEMLTQMPYDEITVMALSRTAGVNHNTFYRHYGCMEDMARVAFEDVTAADLPGRLLGGKGTADEEMTRALRGAMLYARSGSATLQGIARDAIRKTWLDAVGVDVSGLKALDELELDVIFGGVIAALSSGQFESQGDVFAQIMERPVGRGMVESLETLSSRLRT